MKVMLSSLAAVALCAAAATAQEVYDGTLLFREKAWAVELTHDSRDGQLWCSAETTNRARQTLSLTAYDSGAMAMFVFDPGWSITPRPVEFLVDVDYSRWTMAGTGDGIGVSIGLDRPEEAAAFLTELRLAHAVAVMNADGRRLATFSLAGSDAGIGALMGCWESILSSVRASADPFVTAQDPFR